MKTHPTFQILLFMCLFATGGNLLAQAPVACIKDANGVTLTSTDTLVCNRTTIKLTAFDCLAPSSATTWYSWQNLTTPTTPVQNSADLQTPVKGVWQVTVSNATSSATKTFEIKHKPEIPFSINSNSVINPPFINKCSNADTTLLATIHTDIDPSSYKWYRGSITSTVRGTGPSYQINDTNAVKTTLSTQYYVTATYNVTGCTLQDNVPVPYWEAPYPNLGPSDTAICNGQSITLMPTGLVIPKSLPTVPTTIYNRDYSYRWNGGPPIADSIFVVSSSNYTVSTVNTYRVIVEGPGAKSCRGYDTIKVRVNPLPVLNTVPSTLICYGDTLTFNNTLVSNAAGPYTFAWSPKATLNDSSLQAPRAFPTAPSTTYTVTVKVNSSGCTDTKTRVLNVNPQLFLTMNFTDSTICPGASAQAIANVTGGSGAINYAWTPTTNLVGSNIYNPTITPSAASTYTVRIKDAINCEKEASVNFDMLWVELGDPDTLALIGETVTLDASNPSTSGYSFVWKDASGTPVGSTPAFSTTITGTYTVSVFNGTCMVEDTKEVTFLSEIVQKVFVPNVFNPSMSESDNSNLRVYGNNVSNENFKFRVYNKWGELVYESSTFDEAHNQGWNGSFKNTGQSLNAGVYTYTLIGQFYDGTTFEKSGTASLLR